MEKGLPADGCFVGQPAAPGGWSSGLDPRGAKGRFPTVWLPRPSRRLREALKRLIDVSVASLGLLLLSPVFLLLAVVVRASSRGPALYRWRVVGRDGKPFVAYKFRTMVADADLLKPALRASNEMNGPVFKMRNDPRVTGAGQWLRRASLDELPQLWSVLKGDMSLVGPRPPLEEEYEHFEPWHRLKLSVRPGMTCLWQVGGRSEVRDFDTWVRMDLDYIERWSLWLDLKILLRTIGCVLRGRGAH